MARYTDRQLMIGEIDRLRERCEGMIRAHGRRLPKERRAALKLFCGTLTTTRQKLERSDA